MKYSNLEKIKYLMMDDNIETVTRYLYLFKTDTNRTCYTKVARTLFGEEKIDDIWENCNGYYDETLKFYEGARYLKDSSIKNELNTLFDNVKIKNIGWLQKRSKKIRKIVKLATSNKFKIYKYLYSNKYAGFTLEDFKHVFRSDDEKNRLKQNLLQYIEYTDLNKKKQSKMYSVSRDMDKDVFYITNEGKLAKIRKWLYLKYRKKCIIDKYGYATNAIAEGIIVKPMKLINKIMPKANNNMKILMASLFESIKECEMVIDTNFEIAYNRYYNSHQDTDGDKASNYSCMSGEGKRAQNFYGKINGCKVVRWQTKDGKQVGRCIMYEWEGKRHFIRIYGDYPYHRTMINMLETQMKEGDLFGRNKCIEDIKLNTTIDWDTRVMYLDGNYYGLKEENGKWYMIAHKYDYDCKTTSGNTLEIELEDSSVCEHCGARRNNDDGIWINDYFYCDSECAEADGWRCCNRCGEWEREDDCIYIDGEYYCSEVCAENQGYGYDNYYEEWADNEDLGLTDDGNYTTTRSGASEYYGVEEEEVDWDNENCCWKRPIKEEEETKQENNEQ